MVYQTKLVDSSARRVSFELADPPCPSHLVVPTHLVKPPLLPGQENMVCVFNGVVNSLSGEGLLLLQFLDLRARAGLAEHEITEAILNPDVTFFVCNPISGQLVHLPDIDGSKKSISCSKMGIVTKSELPHQPRDRYAVAALNQEHYWERGQQRFLMRRFLSESQKGEWDNLVSLPSPLPVARRVQCIDHDVVAFAGRLWWVDVGWGAVSADPFSDQPDLRFVELPKGRVTEYDAKGTRELGRYRRIGVSDGRLRYVEVSQEKPFVISSFVLDNDGSSWMLEHQVALSPLLVDGVHPNHTPRIGVVDPLNSSIIHLTIGNIALAVNMAKEEVLGCSELAEAGECVGPAAPTERLSGFLKPCVLPPWLGSSQIPSAGDLSHVILQMYV
ncbi:hypothetical protein QOZ80_5BG0417600 [Eleusine coracana subsp. coracana]|nr:hypothetical protein QOZ80_5BG0417600 [Eleusine coracana subsp. coracana]